MQESPHLRDPTAWISGVIQDFTSASAANRLGPSLTEKAFDLPLVGFASGADAIFEEYVNHIGEFYLTPLAIFHQAFPQAARVQAQIGRAHV